MVVEKTTPCSVILLSLLLKDKKQKHYEFNWNDITENISPFPINTYMFSKRTYLKNK